MPALSSFPAHPANDKRPARRGDADVKDSGGGRVFRMPAESRMILLVFFHEDINQI
jgi:hypothetical protein